MKASADPLSLVDVALLPMYERNSGNKYTVKPKHKSKFRSTAASISQHWYSKTAILVTWKRNIFICLSWKPHHKSAAPIWYQRPRCKEAKANWQISPLINANIPVHAQICSSHRTNFHFMHNSQSAPNHPRLPPPFPSCMRFPLI